MLSNWPALFLFKQLHPQMKCEPSGVLLYLILTTPRAKMWSTSNPATWKISPRWSRLLHPGSLSHRNSRRYIIIFWSKTYLRKSFFPAFLFTSCGSSFIPRSFHILVSFHFFLGLPVLITKKCPDNFSSRAVRNVRLLHFQRCHQNGRPSARPQWAF